MKTKEIDGVLYKLVPEEREKSCRGCVFKDQNGAICTILTKDCNKSLIYKKVDEPISNSRLKPFNLEEAKAGKSVCTRDGAKARIICFDAKSDAPIIALITTDDETEITFDYLSDGTFFNSENPDNDLMMLPEKKEGWIIKPKDYQVYQSKEDAEEIYNKNYQVVAKITWEE